MVSIADVPEVVYTNEQIINRVFSYLNEGDIKQVVERSLDSETTDKSGGLKKIINLKLGRSSTDEEELELVREFDSVGKFAVLHGILQDENDITHIKDLDKDNRSKLDNGDFIEAKGKISSSPINDIQSWIENAMPYLNIFDSNIEIKEQGQNLSISDVQDLLGELNSGEDIYTVNNSVGPLDTDVVFSIDEGGIDGPFSEYTEYHVLGRIEHVYSRGEEEWLVDVMNLLPGNDRETRQRRRKFLKQMASGSSDLLDRNVTEDDFKITYPDVRVRPVAIYIH